MIELKVGSKAIFGLPSSSCFNLRWSQVLKMNLALLKQSPKGGCMIIFSLMLATVTAKWSFYLQQLQYNWINTLGSGGGMARRCPTELWGVWGLDRLGEAARWGSIFLENRNPCMLVTDIKKSMICLHNWESCCCTKNIDLT